MPLYTPKKLKCVHLSLINCMVPMKHFILGAEFYFILDYGTVCPNTWYANCISGLFC